MESLDQFYKNKSQWIPKSLQTEIGHFNIFKLQPYVTGQPTKIPYQRRDFYKIMLVKGQSKVHFADRVVKINAQALSFSNPQIPYKWEHLDTIREGIYCIFDTHFFHQFGTFNNYEVFKPDHDHIFELSAEDYNKLYHIFDNMEAELSSDYKYKYDAIRNQVFNLLHFALKLNPTITAKEAQINASQRICMLFTELLERQFPLDNNHPKIQLKSASDYANKLNIHVNYLNKAVKEITGKTTTQLIADRILQESKVLLKQPNWDISQIAYALDFKEATHFSNFFKKHVSISPSRFRVG